MAMGAVVGALFGAEPGARLPAHILRKMFAVFLIVVTVRLLITSPEKDPPKKAGYPIKK